MKKKEHHSLKNWMEKNNIKVKDFAKKVNLSSPHLSCFRSHHKTPSLFNALKIWNACNREFPIEELLSPKQYKELESFTKDITHHE